MELNETDRRLIGALRRGLPLVEHPYAALGAELGLDEGAVIARLQRFMERGLISRFGVVVDHAALGFDGNAMVVWDIPDADVEGVGRMFAGLSWVSLCYRRPRRLPHWRYNLFTMIHARQRAFVEDRVGVMTVLADSVVQASAILHTTRRFKQTAACYGTAPAAAGEA
ncbi:AsnC family transcriptional regulator [Skermanella rosea]|uniref:siroheme decarboxylase subunit beta n=1 Tax=Skermanella rosea TaxID=1817965 RepID=UPI001931BE21|nr:AsnC family transcriptional regulator [Skermanella rosea]UEM06339.1 AsnC family transcriptional regulator [Skermanella rosea]